MHKSRVNIKTIDKIKNSAVKAVNLKVKKTLGSNSFRNSQPITVNPKKTEIIT